MVSPLKPREIAAFLQSNQLLVRGVYEDGHVAPATKRTVMAAALGCADVGAGDGWSVGTRRLVRTLGSSLGLTLGIAVWLTLGLEVGAALG